MQQRSSGNIQSPPSGAELNEEINEEHIEEGYIEEQNNLNPSRSHPKSGSHPASNPSLVSPDINGEGEEHE